MSRAAQVEAAAREILALEDGEDRGFLKHYERENAIGAEKAKLRAALALPADLVSVDARERALVQVALRRACNGLAYDTHVDDVFRAVNATHPRAPSVEYDRGREDAARVCEAAAGYCAARRLYIDGPSEDDAENGIRADVAYDLLENALATRTPRRGCRGTRCTSARARP